MSEISTATLICFDENGDELYRGIVTLDGDDIISFDSAGFEGMPYPHHMKVQTDDDLFVCMSWRDYELGLPFIGNGANSNDFADWFEYNEWVTSIFEEYIDCNETTFVLYHDEIEPFIRSRSY